MRPRRLVVTLHSVRSPSCGRAVGECFAHRDADDRATGGEAEALRQGDTAANAGKAAGADRDPDQIKIGRA